MAQVEECRGQLEVEFPQVPQGEMAWQVAEEESLAEGVILREDRHMEGAVDKAGLRTEKVRDVETVREVQSRRAVRRDNRRHHRRIENCHSSEYAEFEAPSEFLYRMRVDIDPYDCRFCNGYRFQYW